MACQGKTARGTECRLKIYKDNFCMIHHPETAEAQREARSQGGKKRMLGDLVRHEPIDIGKIHTLSDVERAWRDIAESLMSGRIDHNTASSANQILKNLHKSFSEKKTERENPENMSDEQLARHIAEMAQEAGIIHLVLNEIKRLENV